MQCELERDIVCIFTIEVILHEKYSDENVHKRLDALRQILIKKLSFENKQNTLYHSNIYMGNLQLVDYSQLNSVLNLYFS